MITVGLLLTLLALVCFVVAAICSLPKVSPTYALFFVALGLAVQVLAGLVGH